MFLGHPVDGPIPIQKILTLNSLMSLVRPSRTRSMSVPNSPGIVLVQLRYFHLKNKDGRKNTDHCGPFLRFFSLSLAEKPALFLVIGWKKAFCLKKLRCLFGLC